jgi:hypothetical protein
MAGDDEGKAGGEGEMRMKILVITLSAIGLTLFIGLLMGFPVMLLWNWLMPTIFGFKEISFLQALGLSILCRILFKNSSTNSK